MHMFKIERDDSPGEIRAPLGAGFSNYEVMRKTYIIAKPNGQVLDWSARLWLLKGTPEHGAMPKGTPKFHLFRRMTRQCKPILQTPEELDIKMSQLKKTVEETGKMSQFDAEDKNWWATFFSERSSTRSRLGIEGVDCAVDPLISTRIKNLFWTRTSQRILVEPVIDVLAQPEVLDETATRLKDIEEALTPRLTAAGSNEWARAREVGYQIVLPGEDAEVVYRRSLEEITDSRAKEMEELFAATCARRGKTESEFADSIEVQLEYFLLQ
jgi:hypothetical protein